MSFKTLKQIRNTRITIEAICTSSDEDKEAPECVPVDWSLFQQNKDIATEVRKFN